MAPDVLHLSPGTTGWTWLVLLRIVREPASRKICVCPMLSVPSLPRARAQGGGGELTLPTGVGTAKFHGSVCNSGSACSFSFVWKPGYDKVRASLERGGQGGWFGEEPRREQRAGRVSQNGGPCHTDLFTG